MKTMKKTAIAILMTALVVSSQVKAEPSTAATTVPIVVCEGTPAIVVCAAAAAVAGTVACVSDTKCRLRIGRGIEKEINRLLKDIDRHLKNVEKGGKRLGREIGDIFGW